MDVKRGFVCRLELDRGFGFVLPHGTGRAIFFHVSNLDVGLPFDDTLLERRVVFSVIKNDRGTAAVNVRPAED